MLKRTLALLSLSLLLTACGFHLRGTGAIQFALQEINVTARDAYGDLAQAVRKRLEANKVTVSSAAPYTLHISREQRSQRTASYTAGTRSAEITLTTQADFEILGRNNLLLLTEQVEVERTYSYDSNNLGGSNQEANMLRAEMQRELVEQVAMRLQMITPERLDQLQREAERKAAAAAEAEARAKQVRDELTAPQQSPIQIP
ncbi:LPS assembly lipoprotein LptE [Thiopseudomonas alkaliphila]|uniref:LPS-assembly lipoprotein LptE n=1 Tax=Thiopseudomonas alkaliphila TaxID=1697053 RepID=UPI002577BFFF|nr:LPS assembly lipoprotein LptE [Thiopseudomonas alkaliphila]MDM1707120.1 hypothetical protein [Thiopseudomonas alkaliphila]